MHIVHSDLLDDRQFQNSIKHKNNQGARFLSSGLRIGQGARSPDKCAFPTAGFACGVRTLWWQMATVRGKSQNGAAGLAAGRPRVISGPNGSGSIGICLSFAVIPDVQAATHNASAKRKTNPFIQENRFSWHFLDYMFPFTWL
jgi:hypothetical protein